MDSGGTSAATVIGSLELVDARVRNIFRCLVNVDQHHRDVIALLGIGHIDDRVVVFFEPTG